VALDMLRRACSHEPDRARIVAIKQQRHTQVQLKDLFQCKLVSLCVFETNPRQHKQAARKRQTPTLSR
jgi:hypothetical protein